MGAYVLRMARQKYNSVILYCNFVITQGLILWLIDWCLTPTLEVFQLYCGGLILL